MSDLPITFEGLNAADHRDHHLILHGLFNTLIESTAIGDVLGKVSPGSDSTAIGNFQPHFVFDNQVDVHTHSTNGVAALAVQRDSRALLVDASANITGVTVAGLELLGNEFASVIVRLAASVAITVNWSVSGGVVTRGIVPTSMAPGDYVIFELQRWNV